MLTVEVKGISFENKGAELMLHAIQQEFAHRNVKTRFVVEPIGDYERRASFKLWQKTRLMRRRVNWLAPFALLPKRLRSILGLVNAREINVVLDASGFSYGEQWSPQVAKDRLASTISTMKKRGVKVILLPQALGPFDSPRHKKYFSHILNNADKVFARDQHSFAYASGLLAPTTDAKVLERCGDFTNLVNGVVARAFDSKQHQVCFIPNSKMIEKRSDGDAYLAFMVDMIELTLKQKQQPFILIHEAAADRALAERIQQQLSQRIPVLDPQHALKIKWIIGQSKVVISSRFHGLVSALAQGVPVIGTGWSHKYEELLGDYAMAHCLFDVTEQREAGLQQLLVFLQDAASYEHARHTILANAALHKASSTHMWDEVFRII